MPQGYEAIGNEFSYFMLLTSAFVLNCMEGERQWVLHPWLHSAVNHQCDGDQLRAIHVPDVHPAEVAGAGGTMTYVGGGGL
jgi:carnosine N-methyltransferase